jgi:hypothetical protein
MSNFEWGEVLDELTSLEQRIAGITREFAISMVLQTEHTVGTAFNLSYDGEITFDLPPGYAIRLLTSTTAHGLSYATAHESQAEECIMGCIIHTGFQDLDVNLLADDQPDPVFYDEDLLVAFGIDLMHSLTAVGVQVIQLQPHQVMLGKEGIIPPLNRLLYALQHINFDTAGATAVDLWTFVTVTFGIVQLSKAQEAGRIWEQTNTG